MAWGRGRVPAVGFSEHLDLAEDGRGVRILRFDDPLRLKGTWRVLADEGIELSDWSDRIEQELDRLEVWRHESVTLDGRQRGARLCPRAVSWTRRPNKSG